jgi:taurine dioxygenase
MSMSTVTLAPSLATAHPGAAATPAFAVHELDAPLGARVTGLDASQPLSAHQVLTLKAALREHHVLVFDGQRLDDEQFLAFTSHFGSVFRPPANAPVLGSDPYGGNTPDVVLIANTDGGLLGNDDLTAHSDHHWTPQPSAASLLYALQVPEQGGDTTWHNAVLAYELLDEATRLLIDGLQLITYNPFLRKVHPLPGGQRPLYRTPDIEPLTPFVAHPLVRTHPDSGKRLIYLDSHTEVEVLGLPPAEGQALIERLRAHLLQPSFAYTHRWQAGDIVWWDNQATVHSRTAFAPEQVRKLKRISLAGTRPF